MTVHPMDDRTVVITGANSGVGLETAVALAGAGARVVMGCRNAERAAAAREDIRRRSGNDQVESHRLDLADLDSVRAFAADLSGLDRIDVLVNNAGLVLDRREETVQGFEAMFGINHLGHFVLTELLMDQLRAAGRARIVNLTSVAHRMAAQGIRWGDLDRNHHFQPWLVYAESKLANLLHARALAARLEGTGIVAHAVHPGSVHSDFGHGGDVNAGLDKLMAAGSFLLLTPEQGARTSVHVATSPEAGRSTGVYWVHRRPHTPSAAARRRGAAEELWWASERLVAAAG